MREIPVPESESRNRESFSTVLAFICPVTSWVNFTRRKAVTDLKMIRNFISVFLELRLSSLLWRHWRILFTVFSVSYITSCSCMISMISVLLQFSKAMKVLEIILYDDFYIYFTFEMQDYKIQIFSSIFFISQKILFKWQVFVFHTCDIRASLETMQFLRGILSNLHHLLTHKWVSRPCMNECFPFPVYVRILFRSEFPF